MVVPHSKGDGVVSVRLAPFEALRRAGFPAAHIVKQVKRHLDELARLKDDTPHKAEAVAETKAYLASLEAGASALASSPESDVGEDPASKA